MGKTQSAQQDAQQRDALLLKLLKTPPQPRPKRDRDEPKPMASIKLIVAYLSSHWRGQQRLWVSFWINGVAVVLGANLILLLINQVSPITSNGILASIAVMGCVMVWQVIGIIRCSIIQLRSGGGIFGKLMAVGALLVMAAVGYLTIKDLVGLGIIG